MKAKIYSIEGIATGEMNLPTVFKEIIRTDLIKRAFHALRSSIYQKMGTDPRAGMKTSAAYFGRRKKVYRTSMNKSLSRLPRLKLSGGRLGQARRAPRTRGGRRAHPPKVNKILVEKINTKEKRKAIRSAIAATASKEQVIKRGHKITIDVPVIMENKFEEMNKTKDVKNILTKLVKEDLKRGEKKSIRAGRGTTRGRKYKKRKSVLIVINEDKGISKAAKNIPGVDVSLAKNINAELLAPGGVPGRLTVYTEESINTIDKLFK